MRQIPGAEASALLTENGLKDALNGTKFKANKTRPAINAKPIIWLN